MSAGQLQRVRVASSGWTGGPGLNTFYFESTVVADVTSADLCLDRVHAAFTAVRNIYASDMVLTINPQVDILDAVTGNITGSDLGGTQTAITGGGGDVSRQAPHTAMILRLRTGVYDDGSNIQGRAFLSPLYSQMTDGAGTPTATAIGLVESMGNELLDAGISTNPQLVVWRRPRVAVPEATPPVTARDGLAAKVTVTSCPDKFAVLRSRRD